MASHYWRFLLVDLSLPPERPTVIVCLSQVPRRCLWTSWIGAEGRQDLRKNIWSAHLLWIEEGQTIL